MNREIGPKKMHNCRLCNRHRQSFHPIFKVVNSKVKLKAMSLCEQILKYVGVEVDFNDNLSHVLCSDCRNRVIQWNRFVIKCNKVQQILSATLDTGTDQPVTDNAPPTLALSVRESDSTCDGVVSLSSSSSLTTNHAILSERKQDGIDPVLEKGVETPILPNDVTSTTENDLESLIPQDVEPVLRDHTDTILESVHKTCTNEISSAVVETKQVVPSKVVDVLADATTPVEHKETTPNLEGLNCKHCGKTYKSKRRFKEHVATIHEAPVTFLCEQCSKVFTSRSSLRSHMQTHNPTRNYCCHICGYTFQTSGALRSHMTVHRSDYARFACTICGKDFKLRQQLTRHQLIHSDVRAHACPDCPLTFVARHNLTRHIKNVHCPPPPASTHRCPTCDKEFRHLRHYRTHLQRHAGVRDKRCNTCDKMFVTRQSLVTHFRVHLKEKKYKCPTCPKTFSDFSNHRRHVQKHNATPPTPAPSSAAPVAAPVAASDDSKTYACLETFYQSPHEMAELMSDGDEYNHMDINEFLPSEECVTVADENHILISSQVYSSLTLKGNLKAVTTEVEMEDFNGDIRHVGNLFSTDDDFEMGMFLEVGGDEGEEGSEILREDLFLKDGNEESREQIYAVSPTSLIDEALLD